MRHAAAARARARRARTGAHRGGRGGRNARHHGAAVAWCARHTRKGNVRQHACRHRRKARENYTRDVRGASKVRTARGVSAALKRGADTERQSLRKDTCCCGAKETAAEPHTCAPVVQAAATDRAAGRAACVRLAGRREGLGLPGKHARAERCGLRCCTSLGPTQTQRQCLASAHMS